MRVDTKALFIFKVSYQCWSNKPTERPKVEKLIDIPRYLEDVSIYIKKLLFIGSIFIFIFLMEYLYCCQTAIQ